MISKANQRHRVAFTLLEITLVLALIVAIFALAASSLRGSLETSRLRTAAESVRAEFARARVRAMRTGRIQMFRCQQAGGAYTVVDWEAAATQPIEALNGDFTGQPREPGSTTDVDLFSEAPEELPEDVEFLALAIDEDLRANQLLASDAATVETTTGTFYHPPIVFYADGTTSTARLVLKNTQNRAVEVSLRGLTGTVRIGDVTSLAEALE